MTQIFISCFINLKLCYYSLGCSNTWTAGVTTNAVFPFLLNCIVNNGWIFFFFFCFTFANFTTEEAAVCHLDLKVLLDLSWKHNVRHQHGRSFIRDKAIRNGKSLQSLRVRPRNLRSTLDWIFRWRLWLANRQSYKEPALVLVHIKPNNVMYVTSDSVV